MSFPFQNLFTTDGHHCHLPGDRFEDYPFDNSWDDEADKNYDDDHRAQCRVAEENYHHTLVNMALLWLTECAQNGWTPADLRHEFSAQIDPLLFHSLSILSHTIPEQLLDHWFSDTRPGKVTSISVVSLEKIVNRLPLLPPLQDWTLLTGGHLHDSDMDFLDSLTPKQQKAHEKIRSLLRKAESTNFEMEAEALIEKAESLRQQYRLEELLAGSYSDSPTRDAVVSTRVRFHSPWVKYQMRLLGVIARANSCEALLLTESGIATIFGTSDDVAHVVDLFTSLNRQREHFMRSSAGARTAQERRETSSYRRSFMISYATRIGSLLHRAAEDVLDDLGDTAPSAAEEILPVLRERSERVHQTMGMIFPHTRTMSVTANNALGYRDGYDAAGKSHFGGDSSGLSGQRSLTIGTDHGSFPT